MVLASVASPPVSLGGGTIGSSPAAAADERGAEHDAEAMRAAG